MSKGPFFLRDSFSPRESFCLWPGIQVKEPKASRISGITGDGEVGGESSVLMPGYQGYKMFLQRLSVLVEKRLEGLAMGRIERSLDDNVVAGVRCLLDGRSFQKTGGAFDNDVFSNDDVGFEGLSGHWE